MYLALSQAWYSSFPAIVNIIHLFRANRQNSMPEFVCASCLIRRVPSKMGTRSLYTAHVFVVSVLFFHGGNTASNPIGDADRCG
jgi:hypothetical protein